MGQLSSLVRSHREAGLRGVNYFEQIALGEPMPTCATCRFFHAEKRATDGGRFVGECRIRSLAQFPVRYSDDFCGEHRLSHAEIKRRVAESIHPATRKLQENINRAESLKGPSCDSKNATPASDP